MRLYQYVSDQLSSDHLPEEGDEPEFVLRSADMALPGGPDEEWV